MRLLPVLVLSLCVGACAAPGAPPKLPGDVNAPPPGLGPISDGLITDVVWSWQRTTQADGRIVVADAPDRYTLQFQPGGRVAVRADCNRGMGAYRLDGGALTLPPFALTKMMCPPGSLDREFLQGLAAVAGHRYEGGDLVLALASGSGTMRFRALPR
jgi:heat shock protein HslJ